MKHLVQGPPRRLIEREPHPEGRDRVRLRSAGVASRNHARARQIGRRLRGLLETSPTVPEPILAHDLQGSPGSRARSVSERERGLNKNGKPIHPLHAPKDGPRAGGRKNGDWKRPWGLHGLILVYARASGGKRRQAGSSDCTALSGKPEGLNRSRPRRPCRAISLSGDRETSMGDRRKRY